MSDTPDHCIHDIQHEHCKRICLNCGHECSEHIRNGCIGDDYACDCDTFEDDPGR